MKNKKLLIILIIIVLVLIAFFTTKIILDKKYNIDYKNNLLNESFSLYQVSYYENDNETKITDIIMMLTFKEEELNICYLDDCYSTAYKIKKDKITIEKQENSSIEGEFSIEYTSDLILTKDYEDNVYVKYYLAKAMG